MVYYILTDVAGKNAYSDRGLEGFYPINARQVTGIEVKRYANKADADRERAWLKSRSIHTVVRRRQVVCVAFRRAAHHSWDEIAEFATAAAARRFEKAMRLSGWDTDIEVIPKKRKRVSR